MAPCLTLSIIRYKSRVKWSNPVVLFPKPWCSSYWQGSLRLMSPIFLFFAHMTKLLEKKLDGNYTRMLRAILNKSWRQHPTRHQLYGHLPPSRKQSKLDEPCFSSSVLHVSLLEKQGRAHKWCTPIDPHIWPGKSKTTSSNIHTAAMWGYGMWPWRPAWGDER